MMPHFQQAWCAYMFTEKVQHCTSFCILGNYTIFATLYHEINEETTSATVIVENPIRDFDVYTNSPILHGADTVSIVTLNFSGDPLPEDVNITDPRFPTGVFCDIDYGDGILGMRKLVITKKH